MEKEIINPPENPPVGPYVGGVKAGNILAVAGQVAFNEKQELIGEGDVRAQTRQVMKNIETILKAAGAKFTDIVKLNTYVTDIRTWREIVEVRQECLGGHQAAATLVGVTALAYPGLMVEIEAWAVI